MDQELTVGMSQKPTKRKKVSYAKWGYIFVIPFFAVYFIFTLYPQIQTIFNSLFEDYRIGLKHVGPSFIGFDNYTSLFTPDKYGVIDIMKYFGNTVIMWLIGAIPQFGCALLLAVIFTSTRLRIKGQGFFKSVFFLPNIIMASAFGLLFAKMFSTVGPVNQLLLDMGWIDEAYPFMNNKWAARSLIAFMNFMMWFGNTTILLMAGIMSIDDSMFESARIDGANSWQVFKDITMPLLKPIFVYVLINSLIGGLQMFDAPQVFTNTNGGPDYSTRTIVMYLSAMLAPSRNYGRAGAISVILFIITGILSFAVYKVTGKDDNK